MNEYNKNIVNQLEKIAKEMQHIGLWQPCPPASNAFLSEQPFAIDTMQAHEWLQWIFIPCMQALIDAKTTFPHNFALYPYFEEAFKDEQNTTKLLLLIKQIDALSIADN